ncbi:MAG: hypothetical protein IJ615_11215 [Bacteroidaceae bacterium]|nr:hypothetical protein [Bacteroidaceae bacterium]
MSLDLYLKSQRPVRHRGTGVFVREDGQTRELKTLDEVKERFPDADLSEVNVYDYEDNDLFHLNLTHNLTEMASHVPIAGTDGHLTLPQDYERDKPDFAPQPLTAYNLLWHPETNPLLEQQVIHRKDDDGEEWDVEVTRLTPELVRQLMAVSYYIASHREELEQYNPENGWGTYDQLCDRTRDLMTVVCAIPFDEHHQYYIYCWT